MHCSWPPPHPSILYLALTFCLLYDLCVVWCGVYNEMCVCSLRPRASGTGKHTVFTGWARMAAPIHNFKMREIKKPNIGDSKPARVTAEVTVDLTPFQGAVRADWERIRQHDIFFLVTVQATTAVGAEDRQYAANTRNAPELGRTDFDVDVTGATAGLGGEWEQRNRDRLGIKFVRGAEVSSCTQPPPLFAELSTDLCFVYVCV
jgi:hypothetical protein